MRELRSSRATRALTFAVVAALGSAALLLATPAPAFAEEPLELQADLAVDESVLVRLMQEGKKFVDADEHIEAALRFYDVVENGSPESPIVQEAQYALGVSLYELKLYHSALQQFEPVVDMGVKHPRFIHALKYLLFIARETDSETNVLFKLSEYPPEIYPPDFADEINYLVGLYYYSQDDQAQALPRFQQVTAKGGDNFVRARYLEGVIHVVDSKLAEDPENVDMEELAAAAANFKEVLRYQRDVDSNDDVDKLAEMATLSLGRLFFSTRQYATAVRYYDQIDTDSSHWLPGIFEVSWVYFQLKKYPRALGSLHTLNSPFFADQYFPESRVLQALILFYNCRYDESEEVVKQFVQDYYPLLRKLQEEVNRIADPNAFYGWLARLSQSTDPDFSERFKRIFNAALADRKLRRKFLFVVALNKELGRIVELAKEHPNAAKLLDALNGEVTGYRSLVVGEAGGLAQTRLAGVIRELKVHLAAALKIKGETLKARRGELGLKVKQEQEAAAAVRNLITLDKEHIEWPFVGEYWKDELGSYRYDIKSLCKRQPTASGGQ